MFLFYSLLFVLLNVVFAYLLYRFMRFVKNYEPGEDKFDLSAPEAVDQEFGYKQPSVVVAPLVVPALMSPLMNVQKSGVDYSYVDILTLEFHSGGAYLDIF